MKKREGFAGLFLFGWIASMVFLVSYETETPMQFGIAFGGAAMFSVVIGKRLSWNADLVYSLAFGAFFQWFILRVVMV